MQMTSSRFFIQEMRFVRSFFMLLLITAVFTAGADVGQTHQLKQQRADLLQQIETLRTDTINQTAAGTLDSLQRSVILLDEQIMKSYDETVSRLAGQKLNAGSNVKTVVYLALLTSVLVIFLALLILIARKRLIAGGYKGWLDVYKQMTSDLVHEVSAEKATDNRLLRVNVVVVIGLLMMSVSVVAYLLRTL